MSDSHGFNKDNLLSVFPLSLTEDTNIEALATSMAEAFEARLKDLIKVLLYPRIDEMPEDLLDILAYDYKVDWWDPNYTLEEKRKTLKESWFVHKTLGTPAAVKRAISAVYPDTTLEEWFDYGGEPYHFRLWINLTEDDVDSDRMRRVLARLQYYKNLRSHNDGVRYFTDLEAEPQVKVGVTFTGTWARDDVIIPTEPMPYPTYETRAVNVITFKAIEAKAHTKDVTGHTVVPTYGTATKMGVAVGNICMRIDAIVKEG